MRLPAASFQFYLEAKQAAAETFLSAQMEAVYEGRLAAELQRELRVRVRVMLMLMLRARVWVWVWVRVRVRVRVRVECSDGGSLRGKARCRAAA